MSSPKILVVDDTEEVRTLLSRVLVGEGYDVLEAVDGPSALQACQDLPAGIQLLLTDLNMPGMDGAELAARLSSRYPEVYVLYISGQSDGDHATAPLGNHRCGFLSKPFLPQTLIQRVEGALAPGRKPAHAAGLNLFSEAHSNKIA